MPNFLPSISAAIGNYRTQRFVWGTAIAVHAGPRFLFTSMYRQYYKDTLTNQAQRLASIACVLNVVENVALIGLTFIPSAYNYGEFYTLPHASYHFFRSDTNYITAVWILKSKGFRSPVTEQTHKH